MQAAVADKQVNREEFSHLTPEQERQLAMDCARGDEEAIKDISGSKEDNKEDTDNQ